jgi:hypothetical protein
MAAIVNDRDVLLQAASVRLKDKPLPSNVFLPGLSGISLSASSVLIKLDANGNQISADPEIKAELRQISGTVVWEIIAGVGTLFGGDNVTKYTNNANMTTDSITVRASIIHNSILYQSLLTITKIRDGVNGAPGQPGQNGERGTVQVYLYIGTPGWDDTIANNAIISYTGSATKKVGDTVTLLWSNQWSQLRYWNGFAWTQPGTIINGDLLVTQSISADKMAANSITASNGAIANAAITSAKIAQEITSDTWYPSGGQVGWAINRDGNAVFRNVTVRGDVHATSIVADSITTNHLQVNSVTMGKILPGSASAQAYGAAEGIYTVTDNFGIGVACALDCVGTAGLLQMSAIHKPTLYDDQSGIIKSAGLEILVSRNGVPIYQGPFRNFLFGNLGAGAGITWFVQFREINRPAPAASGTVTQLLIVVTEFRR